MKQYKEDSGIQEIVLEEPIGDVAFSHAHYICSS